MIITGIILLGYNIINWIIQIFPISTGFSTTVQASFTTIVGYVGMFNPILPYATVGAVLLIIIPVDLGIFAFKNIKWIISHIPFIGGKGA